MALFSPNAALVSAGSGVPRYWVNKNTAHLAHLGGLCLAILLLMINIIRRLIFADLHMILSCSVPMNLLILFLTGNIVLDTIFCIARNRL